MRRARTAQVLLRITTIAVLLFLIAPILVIIPLSFRRASC